MVVQGYLKEHAKAGRDWRNQPFKALPPIQRNKFLDMSLNSTLKLIYSVCQYFVCQFSSDIRFSISFYGGCIHSSQTCHFNLWSSIAGCSSQCVCKWFMHFLLTPFQSLLILPQAMQQHSLQSDFNDVQERLVSSVFTVFNRCGSLKN